MFLSGIRGSMATGSSRFDWGTLFPRHLGWMATAFTLADFLAAYEVFR
jgi:hypothetical protein